MQDFEHLLKKIIIDKNLHARFLNTLSFMELLGAQKLSRLVPFLDKSTKFLEHVAEEYRHAYFLRILAQKVALDPIDDYETNNLLAKHQSCLYINHMHRRLCLLLKNNGLNQSHMLKKRAYLLSTLAIETRALPFYETYQTALSNAGLTISVKSIIAEESDHLAEIRKLIAADPPLMTLSEPSLAIEKTLFVQWQTGVTHEVLNTSRD